MPSDLIPAGVRVALRNAVGGWGPYSVREISDLFNSHGFSETAPVPDAGGQRRTAAEQFHAAIDWTSEDAAVRYLRVVEDVLEHYPTAGDDLVGRQLRRELRRAGIAVGPNDELSLPTPTGSSDPPEGGLTDEIWIPDRIRLFISHLSSERTSVGVLAEELNKFAFSCFVAHDAIEPSREWQEVIIHALDTCDVLLAYVTPGFGASPWTDQEVGWALGRGLVVIPIRAGADPYGFFGAVQGVPAGQDASAILLAPAVVRAIAVAIFRGSRPYARSLEAKMATAVVQAFCRSGNFETTRRRFELLRLVPRRAFRADLIRELREALTENSQLAQGVITEPAPRSARAAVEELFPGLLESVE